MMAEAGAGWGLCFGWLLGILVVGMRREFYSDTISAFLNKPADQIIGELSRGSTLVTSALEATQQNAWSEQIEILHSVLSPYRVRGKVYFEYTIPRLGKRIDVVLII